MPTRKKRNTSRNGLLLAVDVGNTNLTIGAFEGTRLAAHWRLRTALDQTADEWGILFRNLFALAGQDIRRVDGVIISSVVPSLDVSLAAMAPRYFDTEALFVNPANGTGLIIKIDNPFEVGADRVVNGLAAFRKYGGPCVVVDFGTAVNFDVVSAKGEYLGGVITAGIGISIAALFSKTARLPMVALREPEKLIGTNTIACLQSGFYYGSLGMLDGILERLISELGPQTRVVATGGQASLLASGSRFVQHIDEHLTLDGLRLIWDERHKTALPRKRSRRA
ncbi:MAG: type III pantothenate kinase [Acidobacteria bacterium]|nr:type III pantothenate kinase [Acidobacteriota bacterium]